MLILSRQRGVKSGGYMVAVDDRLWRTLDEIARLEGEAADAEGAGNADAGQPPTPAAGQPSTPAAGQPPTPAAGQPSTPAAGESPTPAAAEPDPETDAGRRPVITELSSEGGGTRSKLTPKEIQRELRAGRSVLEVARMAGTEIAWIERFQWPILAEREGIIEAVKSGTLSRPKLGRSGMNVDEAITANLKERKGPVSTRGKGEGWSVARVDGAWEVSYRYSVRGEARDARFSFDIDARTVKALNAVAAQVGWRAEEPGANAAASQPEGGANPGTARANPGTPRANPGTARANQALRARSGGDPEGDPARPGRPNLWGSAIARGGSGAAGGAALPRPAAQARGTGPPRGTAQARGMGSGRMPGQPDLMRGGARAPTVDRAIADRTRGEPTIGELIRGKGAPDDPQSPWARKDRSGAGGGDPDRGGRQGGRGGGRPDPDRQRRPVPPDARPPVARGPQDQKPQRLLSNGDEEDFRAAVARTRATRMAPERRDPQPEERRPDPPRAPAKKRLPDDWLLDP